MIILGLLSRIQRGVCRFCETIGSIGTLKNQSMFASFSKKRADYAKIVTTTTVNRPLQVQDAVPQLNKYSFNHLQFQQMSVLVMKK